MSKKAALPRHQTIISSDALAMRRAAGKNQTQFWQRFGVTQSGASRYEAGRNLPRSVKMLVVLAEGSKREKLDVLEALGVDLAPLAEDIIAAKARAKAAARSESNA